MKRRRLAGLIAVGVSAMSIALAAGIAVAPDAVAAPAGTLTSAVGGCSSKTAAGYDEVFVTGTFTGLTPNTYYQVELDQATPTHPAAKSPPKLSNSAGVFTVSGAAVNSPDLAARYVPGPAAFNVLPVDASGGASTISGTVTVVDGNCVPTQLHATPSLASLQPLHLYLFRLTATLTVGGAPISGLDIIFRTKAAFLGESVTNASGVASLNVLIPISSVEDLLAAGGTYTAVFLAPDSPQATLVSSTSTAPLIG